MLLTFPDAGGSAPVVSDPFVRRESDGAPRIHRPPGGDGGCRHPPVRGRCCAHDGLALALRSP
jgi:hypothetical protein